MSTSTVKRAIGVLVADGWWKGPGREPVRVSVCGTLRSFTEEMRAGALCPAANSSHRRKPK